MKKISLPIDNSLKQAIEIIKNNPVTLVSASPGSGKTTRLPPELLAHCEGQILVLEPRRVAAVAAALRIAEENNFTIGQEVGYQVRFQSKLKPTTRLIFLTEALLCKRMLRDPELKNVSMVILDEFHERSIHGDIAVGILKEMQEMGSPVKIILMSATPEHEKISTFFKNCAVLEVPGVSHKLRIEYLKHEAGAANLFSLLNSLPRQDSSRSSRPPPGKVDYSFANTVVKHIKEATQRTKRDVLVFLPGTGEIRQIANLLTEFAFSKKIIVQTLHGQLSLDEQTSVVQGRTDRQRIVLSTNIAESSITIDGIDTVVDSGLERIGIFNPITQTQNLKLKRISKSSATQRAGRAARQFEGTCLRLWTSHDEITLAEHDSPEIERIDLSESILLLSALGFRNFYGFSWFQKPEEVRLTMAQTYLHKIGAISDENLITQIGKQILELPLSVRFGRIMIEASRLKLEVLGSWVCTILQERDFIPNATTAIPGLYECDIYHRIEFIREALRNPKNLSFDIQKLLRVAQEIHNTASLSSNTTKSGDFEKISSTNTNDSFINASLKLAYEPESLFAILSLAFADRICRRRRDQAKDNSKDRNKENISSQNRALMVGRRGIRVDDRSSIKKAEFFFALSTIDLGQDSETLVGLASPLTKKQIESIYSKDVSVISEVSFDEEKGKFFKKSIKQVFDLPIEEPNLSPISAGDLEDCLPQVFMRLFDKILIKNESLNRFWERLMYIKENQNELDDVLGLRKSVNSFFSEVNFEGWFQKAVEACTYGETSLGVFDHKDLNYFFENTLPIDLLHFLNSHLPSSFLAPSGKSHRIHYEIGKNPYTSLRIQEVFGIKKTPRLFGNKKKLTFHLLGPNYRPVQVTDNLEEFWTNSYQEIRKELRARYPKHAWPEKP